MMPLGSKILVTGHAGLVGSALVDELKYRGHFNVVTFPRAEVDLSDPVAVKWLFSSYQIEYVFHCAAWVGGIGAHTSNSVDAILENSRIQNNVISNAAEYNVKKLLFLSSACAYPKHAYVPIKEDYLLSGRLEHSNAGYALTKLQGMELCSAYRKAGYNFISCIPTNMYGLNDNYNLETSHVLPGMVRRIHEAKEAGKKFVTLWGTGKPIRDFLWSQDMARAAILLMNEYSSAEPVNVGSSDPIRLSSLAKKIADIVEFSGEILWDTNKPDGTPFRYLDNSKLDSMGWKPGTTLEVGIPKAYADFRKRFE